MFILFDLFDEYECLACMYFCEPCVHLVPSKCGTGVPQMIVSLHVGTEN